MGSVKFENLTGEWVTFVKKRANGDEAYSFSLQPNGGTHSYNLVPHGSSGGPSTYETLRLKKGPDANGDGTMEIIETSDLDGLEKVTVNLRGSDFYLEKNQGAPALSVLNRTLPIVFDHIGPLKELDR